MRNYIILFFKGIALGTANVIPGVSGGTIALITGIFERLIDALKSFDIKALKLLFSFKIKEFCKHTDFYFLLAVFVGVAVAIVFIAKLFGYLFANYPVYIWSYFFGLIMASVYFVGKNIAKWNAYVIINLLLGTAIAVVISLLNPLTENTNFFYLILCGVVAVCSMILPGLSGSFIMILLGNYKLVAIDSINNFDLNILFPVLIGAVVGLIAFSHFLSWIFKKYRNQTLALLTGFIFGSLSILWPWKHETYLLNNIGETILRKGNPIVVSYQKYFPDTFNFELGFAVFLIILGFLSIWLMEKAAAEKSK